MFVLNHTNLVDLWDQTLHEWAVLLPYVWEVQGLNLGPEMGSHV